MAGSPVASAAWRAFNRAFAKNVVPVSSGAATPTDAWSMGANGSPSSSAWNSRSLPGIAAWR